MKSYCINGLFKFLSHLWNADRSVDNSKVMDSVLTRVDMKASIGSLKKLWIILRWRTEISNFAFELSWLKIIVKMMKQVMWHLSPEYYLHRTDSIYSVMKTPSLFHMSFCCRFFSITLYTLSSSKLLGGCITGMWKEEELFHSIQKLTI